jgi:hypothetical protein
MPASSMAAATPLYGRLWMSCLKLTGLMTKPAKRRLEIWPHQQRR